MPGFAGLRVVDFTGELGPYAGRLCAGLGADVVHVEPLRGNPLRDRGPFYRNRPGRDRGLPFLYYNAGKRGLALALEREEGREIFRRLCARSDLVLESAAPGYLESLGLGFPALRALNPRLVQASITPFGHTGPYRNLPGTDLVCSALGGFLYLAGAGAEKPVRACDNQAFRMAEAYAAAGSAAAVFHARRTGRGQFLDVSCIEAVATALENAPQYYDLEGKIRRGGGKEAGTGTIHPCRDGYVVIVAIMGSNTFMWEALVRWLKTENAQDWQLLDDPCWTDPAYRATAEAHERFRRVFEGYTLGRDKGYLYETGQAFRVAVSPVSNGRDLLENPQLRERGFWQSLRPDGLEGDLVCPGAPVRFGRLAWRIEQPAPRLGQHTAEILKELGYDPGEVDRLIRDGVARAE